MITKLDFLRKIFNPQKNSVPSEVMASLPEHFLGATGVEWTRCNELWEALFLHDGITKIARFDLAGKLVEYRVNISPESIPSPIRESSGEWEIMNCIAVYSTNNLSYELIVRDSELIRYQLWFDSLGNQIRLEKL